MRLLTVMTIVTLCVLSGCKKVEAETDVEVVDTDTAVPVDTDAQVDTDPAQ